MEKCIIEITFEPENKIELSTQATDYIKIKIALDKLNIYLGDQIMKEAEKETGHDTIRLERLLKFLVTRYDDEYVIIEKD